MSTSEDKIKHLEFIQNIITRMNTNSFLIKSWTVTIVAALFALAAKDSDKGFVLLSFFPTIIFWELDTFYLRQERLFRHLYDKVRIKGSDDIDYDMSTEDFKKEKNVNPLLVFFSLTLSLFYLSIFAVIVIIMIFTKNLKTW